MAAKAAESLQEGVGPDETVLGLVSPMKSRSELVKKSRRIEVVAQASLI